MIVVDRIINDLAVCIKDNTSFDIPLSQIDGDIHEGDILKKNDDGSGYFIDMGETEKRKNDITSRFNRIKARKKQANQ